MTPEQRHSAGDALARVEASLDPAHPQRSGLRVLAYGEISAALLISDEPALVGIVAKRMAGFRDAADAAGYVALLREYLARLGALGVATLPTEPITIARPGAGPTVYLLQPQVAADKLGNHVLLAFPDDGLRVAIGAVLDTVATVLTANKANPDDQISIDAQLSNWAFDGGPTPTLIDVGTPFIRRRGQHAFDQEILLSAVPPGIRAYYRRKGTAAQYMDDYFDARLIAVDLLGNFIKEGAAARLPLGLGVVNEWLNGPAAGLPQSGTPRGPVTEAEVAAYYEQDAATLELFLRVRRVDRGLRRLLRRPYDFILPGPVSR